MQSFQIEQGLQAYYETNNPSYQKIVIDQVERQTEGWETIVFSFRLQFVDNEKETSKNLIIRLYPNEDGIKKVNDEFNILTSMMLTTVTIPDVYRMETDNSPFGIPFLIMERIEGPLLSQYIVENPSESEYYLKEFGRLHVDIHELDWKIIIQNAQKYAVENPYRYIVNQLNYYKDLMDIHDKKEFIPVLRWLVERMDTVPNDHLSLLHNDFHLGNVILNPDKDLYVIDWFNASVGDFRTDLAWTLVTHETVINKQTRDIIFNAYRDFATYEVEEIKYFEVYACLRRLMDISINFSLGSEQARLNPTQIGIFRENLLPVRNVLSLLYGHTRIKLPEFERTL